MTTLPTCETCRFVVLRAMVDRRHECRRLPPGVGSLGWPVVNREDWCGEHQPVPNAAPANPTPQPPADIKPGDVPWQVGQVWETRGGHLARVTYVRSSGAMPIVGEVLRDDGENVPLCWARNGRRSACGGTDGYDITLLMISPAPVPSAPAETGKPAAHECVIDEIAAERQRQISVEGFSYEHDDEHDGGELAISAAVYAEFAASDVAHRAAKKRSSEGGAPARWPWSSSWFKPTTRRRDLIRAAALIVAEIERLDRVSAVSVPKPPASTEPAPDDDGWVTHDGKSWPLCAPGGWAEVIFGDCSRDCAHAGELRWIHKGNDRDILAYRPAKRETK